MTVLSCSNHHSEDIDTVTSLNNDILSETHTSSKEIKGRPHTYYQVLIDSRDVPHIVSESRDST